MKKSTLIIAIILLLQGINTIQAQDITFTFANAETTNDGTDDYYEVDVQISSTTDFKLGSGLLYFTYNTAAFGINVKANSNVEYTYPNGTYILGEHDKDYGVADLYKDYISNDNTDSRTAFSWQQNYSSEVFAGNNVTSTAANLFHIKIKFADSSEDPSFCFETGSVYLDQTYTACGSSSSAALTSADCTNYAGTQLLNDNFDCSAASLPVELLYFTATPYNEEDALLVWETASELNNAYFEVQRSADGVEFEVIGKIAGAGTTTEGQYYELIDQNPLSGKNYYRLRQVDFDENFEYSPVRVVEFEGTTDITAEPIITAFPNPVVYTLNIRSDQAGIENIQVYNSLGQLVIDQHTNATDYSHQINVESLASGAYYIKVNGVNKSIKFIKD